MAYITKKCCSIIVVAVVLIAILGVGIYFAVVERKGDEVYEKFLVTTIWGTIETFDLSTNNYTDTLGINEYPYDIVTFDYYDNRTVYYATNKPNSIIQSSFLVESSSSLPDYTRNWTKTAIAVDRITGNIYVVDRIEGKIHVSDRLGQHHKELILDLDEPRDIHLIPMNGTMFVLLKSSIAVIPMSGGNPIDIINKSGIKTFTMDTTNLIIYYATCENVVRVKNEEETVMYKGSVRDLAAHDDVLAIVAKDNKFVLCLDPDVNPINCTIIRDPYTTQKITGVKVYNDLTTIENPCLDGKTGCEHLCLTMGNGKIACDCDDGWKLNDDGKLCSPA